MKREFLEKLGLGKEAIGAVMAEHGKSIEELRLRCEAMEKTEAKLTALTKEAETLKKALAEKIAAFASFRDRVIASVIADAHPSSELARAEMIRRLCAASERGEDLKEALRGLREEDPDAFAKRSTSLPVFSAVCFASEGDFPSLSTAMRRR